jgi:hypothetical protein
VDLRETGCEDGRWMELTQDRVEWWARSEELVKVKVVQKEFFYS